MREESRSSSDRNRNSMDRDRSRFRVRGLRDGEGRRERRFGTGHFRQVWGDDDGASRELVLFGE